MKSEKERQTSDEQALFSGQNKVNFTIVVRLDITLIHILKLCGELEVCEYCGIAKARQKNVNKVWTGGSRK